MVQRYLPCSWNDHRIIVFSTAAQRNGEIFEHSHSSTWKDFSASLNMTRGANEFYWQMSKQQESKSP